MKDAEAMRALTELVESKGWEILSRAIEADMLAAAMGFADNPTMTEKEIDFRRGAIRAAKQLLNAPRAMIANLESSLLMANNLKTPAKAGERTPE